MRILGLIPARGGSKGIPRKNIKLLHGKALIAYSIESALACSLLDQVVVTTDDDAIAALSKSLGASVPFIRPAHLAADHSPTIDTVMHALSFFEKDNQFYDAVCLLQPTVPFRNPEDINEAIQKFINAKADSLISVREVPHIYNPYWIYEQDPQTGFLKLAVSAEQIITRRQDLPSAYHRDGSIYITKSNVVQTQKSLYGNKIIHHLMKRSPDINIDTMDDWTAASNYANNEC